METDSVPQLPLEIFDRILLLLGEWACQPRLAFRAATFTRRNHVRFQLLHLVVSMDRASELGLIDALDRHKSLPNPTYSYRAINYASAWNRIDVLEWWLKSGLPLKYERAMDEASMRGHISVLEWWNTSGIMAVENNHSPPEHVRVLMANVQSAVRDVPWYFESTSAYTEVAMNRASMDGSVAVLDWWRHSGLALRYNHWAMDGASKNGHTEVLEWWKNSGLHLDYTTDAVDMASQFGHVVVLEWWKNSGLEMRYTNAAMARARSFWRLDTVSWWEKSGLEIK
ncbi:hypothetical protein BJ742DRAFT_832345 [Cladochytrium replicatum]|nr:hypothetical protein BJ742DRAFT_832345 [Cladochytrium replicatum]